MNVGCYNTHIFNEVPANEPLQKKDMGQCSISLFFKVILPGANILSSTVENSCFKDVSAILLFTSR